MYINSNYTISRKCYIFPSENLFHHSLQTYLPPNHHPPLSTTPSYLTIHNNSCFTINSHLDYSDHISIIIRNANYFLYNIRKSRNKLTFSMITSIIHSLVFSRLIYSCSLLFNLPLKLMLKLEMIQRRSIRTLYKLKSSSIVSISP